MMAYNDDERRGMSLRDFLEYTGLTTLTLGTGTAMAGIPTIATAAESCAGMGKAIRNFKGATSEIEPKYPEKIEGKEIS